WQAARCRMQNGGVAAPGAVTPTRFWHATSRSSAREEPIRPAIETRRMERGAPKMSVAPARLTVLAPSYAACPRDGTVQLRHLHARGFPPPMARPMRWSDDGARGNGARASA